MKKLIYIIALIITVLTFTSCEKETYEPETPGTEDTIVTPNETQDIFNVYDYVTNKTILVGMDTTVNDTLYEVVKVLNTNDGLTHINIDLFYNGDKLETYIYSIIDPAEENVTIRFIEPSIRTIFSYNIDGKLYKIEYDIDNTTTIIYFDTETGEEISREVI